MFDFGMQQEVVRPSALIETLFVPRSVAKAYCLGRVFVKGNATPVGEIHHVEGVGAQSGNYFIQTEFFDNALRAYVRFARRLIDRIPLPKRGQGDAYWIDGANKIMAIPLRAVLQNPLAEDSNLYQLLCEGVVIQNSAQRVVVA